MGRVTKVARFCPRAHVDRALRPQVRVKLSAPYESSRAGPPAYEDVTALALALVHAAPERML